MKIVKLISIFLAVLMLLSSLVVVASAAEENDGPKYSTLTGNGNSLLLKDPNNEGQYLYKDGKYKGADGKTHVISTAEEKIALMDYRYGTDKYELYVDAYSGEVAVKSKESGEILFTNPYTIGNSKATAAAGLTKDELLSQIIVNYSKVSDNTTGMLCSYTWAAVRNQIVVKNIKGGIRVEYTIGREENRSLLPRMVEASVMENIFKTIETNMEEAIAAGQIADPDEERQRLVQFKAYYNKYSLDDAYDAKGELNIEIYNSYVNDFPILAKFENLAKDDSQYEHFAIYVVDEKNMGENVVKKQENLIKDYCKEYTYEQLDADHAFVEYEAETENYPLFKLALEYFVEDSGLVVKLPANGIRFDEALYRLDSIDVLPYMGAGMNPNKGYTFFPDGSGTIFDFQEIAVSGKKVKVSGKVYGPDFAYHQLTGNYEEIIRYPVFGIYEEEVLKRDVLNDKGETVTETYTKDRGFVAIVEEGDSLMQLSTYHGGVSSEYNTVMMSVFPRPTDSYNMKDAISVGQDTEWTVVSDRKYTGSYTVRYIMLTDDEVAKDKGISKYYETSYVGMANAYRDYLIGNGVLTKLTEDDVEEDIPLYIETFGAFETTEKFLTIPINVMTPLTSFDDIKTMYEDLSKTAGITNVNFILTGYTDGGMTDGKVPYHLKWESAVKKKMDFDELDAYAKQEGFGLFPNFDFVFAPGDKMFDGLSYNKHAAKTIDDRYTSRREYSATKHTYVSYFEIALSPAYFDHFYEKFIPKYAKYEPTGISVSTLGSYLNSDFDEDEPYNRADSQMYTIKALEYISNELENTEIMTSGGNAFTWKYIDHLTDVALDSSRFTSSAASIPFMGIVLHGYVEMAGTPLNMEGNLDYAFLKALENGTALKFILSYRNTDKLKESPTLSRYYSINYKNWYVNGTGDLVTMYHELNELLKDVQTSTIVGHTFLDGVRVPDDDELALDAQQAIKDAILYEEALANANSDDARKVIFNARQLIIKGTELLKTALSDSVANNLRAQLAELNKIYDPDTNAGEYAEALANAEKVLKEAAAYQQLHAITADAVVTPADGKLNKLANVTVEAAIEAYKKLQAATAGTEEYTAAKEAYNNYAAIIGEDYILAAIDYLNATEEEKEAKKAVLSTMVAGTDVAPEKAVELMEALSPYEQAWIDANASGDATATEAAKKAFDEKLNEIYGALVATLAEELTFEGTKVGGTRFYRDDAKSRYTEATAALTEKLNALYANANSAMDAAEQIREIYNLDAMKEAYNVLVEKDAFSDSERARLLAMITGIETLLADANVKAVYDEILGSDINGVATKAYEQYQALFDATNAAGVEVKLGDLVDYELSGFKATDYLKGGAYSWATKIVEEEPTVVAKPVPNTQKYDSDANMIVHEVYENGTEFLMNFNNYRIIVVLNDVAYTIDAYGYLVLSTAKNA